MIPALEMFADGLGRVQESTLELLSHSNSTALIWAPATAANSQGWLVWHLTRVLDNQVAGVMNAVRPSSPVAEVWLSDGFEQRMALPYAKEDTGYGQSTAQVRAFPAVDPHLLAEYHRATQEAVAAWVSTLDAAQLGAVVDDAWDPPVTAQARLVSVLDDVARHIGQAEYIGGLIPVRKS